MKTINYFMVFFLVLSIFSCSKDDNFKAAHNFSNSIKAKFFYLNNESNIGIRSKVNSGYHLVLKELYNNMYEKNEEDEFVTLMVDKIGYPNWEKSTIFMDRINNSNTLLMPFVKEGGNQVSAILTIKTNSGNNGFYSGSVLTYNDIALDTSCLYKYYALEFLNFNETIFHPESDDEILTEKYCECSPSDPPPTTSQPCGWEKIEHCTHIETGITWHGNSLPLEIDHDRDGVENSEDQDFAELMYRLQGTGHTWASILADFNSKWDSAIQEWAIQSGSDPDDFPYPDYNSFYEDFYHDDFDDYYNMDDFGDVFGDYFDIFYDGLGDLASYFFDQDGDGIWDWDDWDRDGDGYPDVPCPWDGEPIKGTSTSSTRTIDCKWYWVNTCDLNEQDWDWIGFTDNIIPFVDCPECDPANDITYIDILNEYTGHYQIGQSLATYLYDLESEAPKWAPRAVVYDWFSQKIFELFSSTILDYAPFSFFDDAFFVDRPTLMQSLLNEYETTNNWRGFSVEATDLIIDDLHLDIAFAYTSGEIQDLKNNFIGPKVPVIKRDWSQLNDQEKITHTYFNLAIIHYTYKRLGVEDTNVYYSLSDFFTNVTGTASLDIVADIDLTVFNKKVNGESYQVTGTKLVINEVLTPNTFHWDGSNLSSNVAEHYFFPKRGSSEWGFSVLDFIMPPDQWSRFYYKQ